MAHDLFDPLATEQSWIGSEVNQQARLMQNGYLPIMVKNKRTHIHLYKNLKGTALCGKPISELRTSPALWEHTVLPENRNK